MAFKIPDDIALELEKNSLGIRFGIGSNGSFCELLDKLDNDRLILSADANDVGQEAEKQALKLAYEKFKQVGRPKTAGQAILEAVSATTSENEKLRAEVEALKQKLAQAEPDEKKKK